MNTPNHNLFAARRIAQISLVLALLLCSASVSAMSAEGVVNINTADQQTLELLPRVGPAVAQRIIEYRDQHGKFAHTTDLMLVRGIGEKTFDQMEAHVVIEGKSTLTEKVRSSKNRSGNSEEAKPEQSPQQQNGGGRR